MPNDLQVLGIETSCDETAAAVVRGGRQVRSNLVFSQIEAHHPYGGVVPEIASRNHLERLPDMLQRAVDEAGVDWGEIDAVAVTYGPGLASSLLVGLTAGKALALRLQKPLVPVNHLEGHLYSIYLGEASPPADELGSMVVLLVTGGHTCLVRMESVGAYRLLGQTLDDAAGEALDKGANLMHLGYPGGPAVEQAAAGGDPAWIRFPRGLEKGTRERVANGLARDFCFSFSGLKTALRYYLEAHPETAGNGTLKHVAASYQEAVFDVLIDRAERALTRVGDRVFACVGGVARNRRLRHKIEEMVTRLGVSLILAPPAYCTDNAAMIAALAGWKPLPEQSDLAHLDIAPNLSIG